MSAKVGSTGMSKLYVGSTEAKRMYVGDTLAYQAAFAHTFSGTTMPPELPVGNEFKYSENGGTMTPASLSVSSGRLNVLSPTGTTSNFRYATGRCFLNPLSTNRHWTEITVTNDTLGASYPRAAGACVGGSNNVFTNGVIAWTANVNGANSLQIFSKVGGTLTQRATVNNQLQSPDKLRLVITHNGTNFVYTAYKNGVSALVWSDTGGIITPGLWPGVVLQGVMSASWFGPQTISAMAYGEN